MRSDLGFATIGQRLAGLASLRTQLQQPPPDVASSTATGGQFSDALQTELADLAAGQLGSGRGQGPAAVSLNHTAAGPSTQSWLDLAQAGYRPPTLPQGVSLTGAPSEIVPARPGTSVAELFGVAGPAGGAPAAPGVSGHQDPGHVHTAPPLDRVGPPPDLQAYGNGRIPAAALEPLGVGDHSLWAPAARGFRDLMAAAAADGITIGINDSYRSYERQVEMVERYGLYSQGGRAASPGSSNHGWGAAVDLDLDPAAQEWMRAHAADYGFVEDVPREPWHWTFRASDYPG